MGQPDEVMKSRKESAMRRKPVDIRIWFVLPRQFNVESEVLGFAGCIPFLCSFVCSFHQTRTASGYDVTSELRNLKRQILGDVKKRIPARDAAAAEYRDAEPPR